MKRTRLQSIKQELRIWKRIRNTTGNSATKVEAIKIIQLLRGERIKYPTQPELGLSNA